MSGECLTISLSGGVPWGFRLQGGAGTNQPLTVSKVRRRSKSYRRLREGDEILTVNGHSCSGLTYDQVMEIADRSDQQLTLAVRRSECNKENQAPEIPSNRAEQKQKTEDLTLSSETTTKVSSETTEHKTTVGDMPDITLDTIDLNNLISATQRKLEDFRPGGASPDMFMEGRNSPGYSKSTITTTESQIRTEISKNMTTTLRSGSEVCQEKKSEKKQDSQSFSTSLPDVLPEISTQSSESSYETTETPFGTTTTLTKKKKMFSSSSFYEEPQSIYPTVEEQVEMAKKIASSLADDVNSKSKGSNMFHKRVKRSTKWIHEGPEPSDESEPSTPEIHGVEPPTPDPSQVPFKPSKAPSKLKLVLDPRHPLDAISLKSSGMSISEHNVISPEVCHGLVKDLHSPVGKGAALFAKRKKKSEEWVVDEEKVRNLLREQERRALLSSPAPPFGLSQHPLARQDSKLIKKSPWEAAMENPFGLCDAAWVSPDQLADTVIRAADQKRASVERSLTSPPPQSITPVAAMHDIYHAKAPKGWQGNVPASTSPAYFPPPSPVICPEPSSFTSGYQPQTRTKPVYQNFNAVPRLWKGTTAH
ncbi:synaptopodin 2-like protein isoform X3 [Uloborus diversus]|uniref:synaptopodin 2-like protein isoform X3 n=1 Tax=Uloborus diversus TaxID=327109 RepID=UPI0024098DD2|nr:synaptopodin 2-like protein isoform X3 [Uloborus diversus]